MFLWSQNSELENKGIGFYSLSCASIVSFFNTSIKVMISKQNNIFYSIFTPFEIPWSFLFIPASPLKRLISTVKLCSLTHLVGLKNTSFSFFKDHKTQNACHVFLNSFSLFLFNACVCIHHVHNIPEWWVQCTLPIIITVILQFWIWICTSKVCDPIHSLILHFFKSMFLLTLPNCRFERCFVKMLWTKKTNKQTKKKRKKSTIKLEG